MKTRNHLNISRRQFIKVAGAAGFSGLLASSGLSCSSSGPVRPGDRHAIVVGSGFGGAITALRLVQNGIRVTLIEKGRRWPLTPEGDTFSPYIYPDGRSTWLNNTTVTPIGPPLPIKRYAGVLEGHFFDGLRVLTGAAYGGGSIVYGGLLVKPQEKLFGQVFQGSVAYAELQPYFQRVAEMMELEPFPDDIYRTDPFRHYRIMEEQSLTAGLDVELIHSASDWNIVRAELEGRIKPSTIKGEAIYGVNSGAKRSLDMNYLAQAEASGLLDVRTLHQVSDIGPGEGRRFQVATERLDERGDVLATEALSSDYVFLAAGSVGTTGILVKARAKGLLPQLNDEVGRGWANNGNVQALRTRVGTPTGRLQGGPPARAIVDLDNPISPLFIEHPQFPLGIECRCLLYFGIGVHQTTGQFFYDREADRSVLSWPKENNDQQTVTQAFLHTMEKLNQANGGVLSPIVGGLKRHDDTAVYHPLGGVVIGKACDNFGRVRSYPGLYVNDGSLVPGFTGGANPAFTIAALAERNIERIIFEDL